MAKTKSDLDRTIQRWKKKNPNLAVSFDNGYESFKIGVLLKQARKDAGLSQTELAEMIDTKRTAIFRLENHAQDVKLSTIEKVARALSGVLNVVEFAEVEEVFLCGLTVCQSSSFNDRPVAVGFAVFVTGAFS